MLIDTHCHINIIVKKNFDVLLTNDDLMKAKELVKEAAENSVNILLNVGTSLPESLNSIALAKHFKSIYAAVGIHPTDLKANWKEDLDKIATLIKNPGNKIVAIGECGIDLYHTQNLTEQEEGFKRQINIALEHDLALVVHSRNAAEETLNILSQFKHTNLRGVIHCFSYDLSIAKEFIKLGFVLGIGGTITYPKNEELRNVIINCSLENIILETDAPFLPPQIIRGKPNHPKYIKAIAEFIAKIKNVSFDNVASQTTKNSFNIFKFSE